MILNANLFRKALRGQFGGFVQCFVPVLMAVAAILILMSGLGCEQIRQKHREQPSQRYPAARSRTTPETPYHVFRQGSCWAEGSQMLIEAPEERAPSTLWCSPPGGDPFRFWHRAWSPAAHPLCLVSATRRWGCLWP